MRDLTAIREEATPASFPAQVLKDVRSAACFYAGAFGGRNDVIHIHDAGVPEVLLNDIDPGCLEAMYNLYPQHWEYAPGDALELAWTLKGRGRSFDLVTVDPWSTATATPIMELHRWLALARKWLIIGIDFHWFATKHLPADLVSFNQWLVGAHWNGQPTPPVAAFLHPRSLYRGGVWWLGFEVET